ncbi:MAG: polysaccharide deacetylase [Solirubrobacterales bacterium]|nr:polysaccharide deacetylase [Solirubrobacterales bacterium]
MLAAHRMNATLYLNSGRLGAAGRLSWTQASAFAAAGTEIGGHTVDHVNLRRASTATARREVCADRATLAAHGFAASSFAYPYGAFDARVESIVRGCGYTSARTASGVGGPGQPSAEGMPPRDSYAVRMAPAIRSSTTLAQIERYVRKAERRGGGWVVLLVHHVCHRCDTYSIERRRLGALLDWLAPRAAHGTVVRTVGSVIG